MTVPLLEVERLRAGYLPGVDILAGLSLTAAENAVTLLIGPNGAGKSTLLRTIFGLIKPSAGRIVIAGSEMTAAGPSRLKAAGVSYITQDINSFPHLTVAENLKMGAWTFRRDAKRVARQLDQVYALFPVLRERRGARAGSLSRRPGPLALGAAALASAPRVVPCARPTAGPRSHLRAPVC